MTEPTDQPYQHPENYAAIGYPTVRTLNRAQKLSIAKLLQHVLPYRPPSGSVQSFNPWQSVMQTGAPRSTNNRFVL